MKEEEDDDEKEVVVGKKLEKRKEGGREAGEERNRKRGMGNPKTNRTKKFLSLTRCIRRFFKKNFDNSLCSKGHGDILVT